MKVLKIIKELFTVQKRKRNHEHEDFMKLMQWGCYQDVNDTLCKNR